MSISSLVMPSLSRKLDYNEPCFEEKKSILFFFFKKGSAVSSNPQWEWRCQELRNWNEANFKVCHFSKNSGLFYLPCSVCAADDRHLVKVWERVHKFGYQVSIIHIHYLHSRNSSLCCLNTGENIKSNTELQSLLGSMFSNLSKKMF